jgi:uncharacterized protein
MPRCLVDAGPLIALFDRDDDQHEVILRFLADFSGGLVTSWAVITETLHMLVFSTEAQLDFLEWLRREALEIPRFGKEHLRRLIELSRKYADVPMDFADASLIVLAESEGLDEIITLDSDFLVYRTARGGALRNLLDMMGREPG